MSETRAFDVSYAATLVGKVTVWATSHQEAEVEAKRRGTRRVGEEMVHYEVTATRETPPVNTVE